jgi:hypothetical protein
VSAPELTGHGRAAIVSGKDTVAVRLCLAVQDGRWRDGAAMLRRGKFNVALDDDYICVSHSSFKDRHGEVYLLWIEAPKDVGPGTVLMPSVIAAFRAQVSS